VRGSKKQKKKKGKGGSYGERKRNKRTRYYQSDILKKKKTRNYLCAVPAMG